MKMAKNQKSFGAASGFFEKEKNKAHINSEMKKDNNITLESTQGRKGQKLPRINMAFTPENHEYIKRVSRQEGKSITQYINGLIEADKVNRTHP